MPEPRSTVEDELALALLDPDRPDPGPGPAIDLSDAPTPL